jgi:hypothetical protein
LEQEQNPKELETVVEDLQEELKDLDVAELEKKAKDRFPVVAFITFATQEGYERCLKYFNKKDWS